MVLIDCGLGERAEVQQVHAHVQEKSKARSYIKNFVYDQPLLFFFRETRSVSLDRTISSVLVGCLYNVGTS